MLYSACSVNAIIVYMHIALRKRDRNSLIVKSQFHCFGYIPIDIPVIIDLDPGTDNKIHRRFAQSEDAPPPPDYQGSYLDT